MKYVCELCGKIYDEAVGDPRRGIAPGTVFAQLSAHYTCPDCGSEKEAYNPVQQQVKPVAATQPYLKYSEQSGESKR